MRRSPIGDRGGHDDIDLRLVGPGHRNDGRHLLWPERELHDQRRAAPTDTGSIAASTASSTCTHRPDLQKHWYHDTAPNAAASLAFPDPRTLVQDLTPKTGVEVVGQESVNGVELTHLRATNLSGLDSAGLDGYVNGNVSSFDVWVDSDNVVEKIAITSSTTGYTVSPSPAGRRRLCRRGASCSRRVTAPRRPSPPEGPRL